MFYRAVVENNKDPKNLQRVQVRVLGVHSQDKKDIPLSVLPWAEPCLPITSGKIDKGYGTFEVPDIGDWVWVFFEECDIIKQYPKFFGIIRGQNDTHPQYKQGDNVVKKDRWDNTSIIDETHEEYTDHFGNHIVANEDFITITNGNSTANVKIDKDGNVTINNEGELVINSNKTISIGGKDTDNNRNAKSPAKGRTPIVNWSGLESYIVALEAWLDSHVHTGNLSYPTTPPVIQYTNIGQPLHENINSPKIQISTTGDI